LTPNQFSANLLITMDPAQAIIFLVIVILTVIFVVLGIQAFRVLKELRLTLLKTNRILDTAEKITDNISNPISTFSQVVTGVKTGSIIASFLKKITAKDLPAGLGLKSRSEGRQEKEQNE